MSNGSEAQSWGSCKTNQGQAAWIKQGSHWIRRSDSKFSNARLTLSVMFGRDCYLRAAECDDPAEEGADGTGDP
jgi:hypothetical protein